MKLIDNAREVFFKAWSVRFAALGALFAVLDLLGQVLPFVTGFVPDKTFTALSAVCGVSAVLARFLKQQNLIPGGDA